MGSVPVEILRAVDAIDLPDLDWAARAASRQARLTMPPGSLGRLLELGRQLASLQHTDRPIGEPALVAVFAADHGVAASGVSAYPSEVTGQMVANYLNGGAAVNVLARRAGATVRVVDLGVASLPQELAGHEKLESHPIAAGTRNFLLEPAMTRDQAYQAVLVGIRLAEQWVRRDQFRVVALGEMGIGNTTASSALLAALTRSPVDRVVGRGTGLDDEGYLRKCRVIDESLALHGRQIADIWDLLARLGGFEILGLAGLALGAARHRALIVLDGLISTVAGLIAVRLCPSIQPFLVASHVSPEPGHRIALAELGITPLLDLGLRLGEGSGAVLALPIIASAADLLRDMATFDSAGISGPA
ncbi:nicotinate-nucleotide-dimethylbenzimidazole phosphoribosyltransferase [Singulisphaera sp. GP187]|uniref:nicotinate-nucleotide--dimethylbenzimidazole phosphoribosyltransferase n=1 Tax=Singulisphaera sp. GP187 TaxID=1882752 RepID=UPI00092A5583|nr:nicotinate-nucleotide--dimethylbenzimidazole phosphoribosyltransferase [Singulisphaera sp. GP187]SIN91069.1 nicotinate-nucleotide-dimethylbenzimidazole phosphoribosyltransferase [Singulisphaera sp. GP187]